MAQILGTSRYGGVYRGDMVVIQGGRATVNFLVLPKKVLALRSLPLPSPHQILAWTVNMQALVLRKWKTSLPTSLCPGCMSWRNPGIRGNLPCRIGQKPHASAVPFLALHTITAGRMGLVACLESAVWSSKYPVRSMQYVPDPLIQQSNYVLHAKSHLKV